MAAVDGVIESLDDGQLTLHSAGSEERQVIPIQEAAEFMLDGQPTAAQQALQVGRQVIIFHQRPQVVEALDVGQPTPGYGITRSGGTERQYAIIDYDHEGRRRVLRDGYNPYFDDPRTKESPLNAGAGPAGWTDICREDAMRLHPDAAAILAGIVLRPAEC
jgi:hypothetical protein